MNLSTSQLAHSLLVHFTLTLADGSVAESTRANGKPALFRLGDNSLSPAIENELRCLQVGEKHKFTLSADQAYGPRNPDLVQYYASRDFRETGNPEVGAILLFTAMDGSEMPGIIREVSGDSVTVDFNHPLAGQAITFDLEVLEIDPIVEVEHENPAS